MNPALHSTAVGVEDAPGGLAPLESSEPTPESRVLVIMTGGTICMRASPAGLVPARDFFANGMRGRPQFNDGSEEVLLDVVTEAQGTQRLPSLRTPISSYGRHVRYTVYEFPTLLDSSSISSEGWTQIASSVRDNYAGFDGFVVLHGTDSMAYTASALSFMFSHLGKPVILTGSQTSIFELRSDAVNNLLGSMIIAGTFSIPEVCLFFHHVLYRGNRSTKISTSAFKAFDSPNAQPLATDSGIGIDVNWQLVRRARSLQRFAVSTIPATAHVACLTIFPGIRTDMVEAVLRTPGLQGLILETFGAGNASSGDDGSLTAAIASATARGIVIINVSQCKSGGVSPTYAAGTALQAAGVVCGQDLTREAALTKLLFLLAVPGITQADVVTQMGEDLRGEMTQRAIPTFSHPPPRPVDADAERAAFAEVGYAIARGDVATVRLLLAQNDGQLLPRREGAGNTIVHLAAIGPHAEVLRECLQRGASLHVRNRLGETPLTLAERVGNAEHVQLLRQSGA